jgi:hypothetical protein
MGFIQRERKTCGLEHVARSTLIFRRGQECRYDTGRHTKLQNFTKLTILRPFVLLLDLSLFLRGEVIYNVE